MKPLISVIIPAYNCESYVTEALLSALNQTYKNIEVLVIDDASTDNTLKIAQSFSDDRLQVFANEKNLGAGPTRNFAIKQARGEWIALLDSDDWFAPTRLEALFQIAHSEKANLIADNLLFIRDGAETPHATLTEVSSEKVTSPKKVDLLTFLKADTCGKFALFSYTKPLIKRDFLVRHHIGYDADSTQVGEDFRFYLRCLVHGACFFYTPEAYYFQRLRTGSLMTQGSAKLFRDFYEGNQTLLKDPLVQQNPEAVKILVRDALYLKRNIAHHSVIEPLKQKKFIKAASALLHNPSFLIYAMLSIPRITLRQIASLQAYFARLEQS